MAVITSFNNNNQRHEPSIISMNWPESPILTGPADLPTPFCLIPNVALPPLLVFVVAIFLADKSFPDEAPFEPVRNALSHTVNHILEASDQRRAEL
jgi:hypothetical protein